MLVFIFIFYFFNTINRGSNWFKSNNSDISRSYWKNWISFGVLFEPCSKVRLTSNERSRCIVELNISVKTVDIINAISTKSEMEFLKWEVMLSSKRNIIKCTIIRLYKGVSWINIPRVSIVDVIPFSFKCSKR